MKTLLSKTMIAATLFSLIATSAFAEEVNSEEVKTSCSVHLIKNNLSDKQDEILHDRLIKKGYSISETEEDADYKLEVNSTSRNRFNSNWFVAGFLTTQKGVFAWIGEDYITVLPLHLLTMGINTLIPTKGAVSMKMMLNDFPTCEELQANPKWN